MLRIAVQSNGRLYDDTMNLLKEADIAVYPGKRYNMAEHEQLEAHAMRLRMKSVETKK